MKFEKNDYIEGFEYFGIKVRKMRGWVENISKDENGNLWINIQCDDEYGGYRGNYICEELGEIKLISKSKARPII